MWTNHRSRTVVAVAVSLLGCSGGGGNSSPTTPTPTPTPVLTSISVSGGPTVAVGATIALVASPKDQNGSAIAATVSWSSGATNIATVNGSGVVTGVAPGTAVITATAGSVNANTTITVTAVPVLTSIILSGGTSVVAGSTLQLAAAPKDQNGAAIAATITWSSSATNIATVNTSGVVTGVAPGSAVITASSGSVNATVTITVAAPVLTTIALSGGGSVIAGQTLQLTASPKDQAGNAIAATMTWSSNATGIATVSNTGLVTGVAVGTAVVTAASGSVNATTTITVTPVPPVLTTIAISGGTTVVAASTLQLTASPKDQNGNAIAATIAWSSNATGIATVSSAGLVTGVAAGTAVITATSGNVSATVTITVTPQVLTSITVSGGTAVQVGATLQLIAAAKDQNGKAMTAVFTWASDATSVATVDPTGKVTGVAVGNAGITASSGGVNSAKTIINVTSFPASADVRATTTPDFVAQPPQPAGSQVDIRVGGTVNWIFEALQHTVTFNSAAPTDGSIDATSNATVSRVFNAAGTYAYHCSIHTYMTGVVIVH